MTHDEIRESLPAYALDALSPDERAAVDMHLRTCAACAEDVAGLSGVGERLALLAEERDPPPGLRPRLLAIVEQEAAEWRASQADAVPPAPRVPASHTGTGGQAGPPAAPGRPGPGSVPSSGRAGTGPLPWRGRIAGVLVAAAAALLVAVLL